MTSSPVASQARYGDQPFFIFGDHASNRVPDDLNALGLADDILQTHIAVDIGSATLIHEMARQLSCEAFFCEFSRLVLDANRAATAHDLIPAISDQIPIPGNQTLSKADRAERLARFHTPYHAQLDSALGDFANRHAHPFVVSIHSYTKRLMGAHEDRPWPVGLLWTDDPASARAMIAFLDHEVDWPVGDNKPYDARDFNYSIDVHVTRRRLRHLTFEIRQDYLGTPADIAAIADLLTRGIRRVAQETTS